MIFLFIFFHIKFDPNFNTDVPKCIVSPMIHLYSSLNSQLSLLRHFSQNSLTDNLCPLNNSISAQIFQKQYKRVYTPSIPNIRDSNVLYSVITYNGLLEQFTHSQILNSHTIASNFLSFFIPCF